MFLGAKCGVIYRRFSTVHFITDKLWRTNMCHQYAFRPTGSTSAAVISLLHTITNLLQSNPFVIVISLDFSKAFDTVRHSTLLAKMAQLELPIPVYNWIVDFFSADMLIVLCSTGKNQQRRVFQPA